MPEKTNQPRETLVLSPHIDDETLGCFSFLGPSTHVLWFGVETFHGTTKAGRLAEAQKVAETMGFSFSLLEQTVNAYAVSDLISPIESQISKHKPHTVLLPFPSYNQDHRAVYEAGFTAVRPHDRLPFVPRILVYEQPHVGLWPRSPFEAQYFRQIDLKAKLQLWDRHRSQHRGHRTPEHIGTLATQRGAQCIKPYAEAFQVLRWVQ